MTEDYYSYKPRASLQRPLVLAGMPGSQVGMTGRVLTMLTGLKLVWVDRQAEHILGRSVEWIDVHAGRPQRLEAEAQVIDKALLERSPPVIATSAVTLTHPDLRRRLEAAGDFLHLRLDPEEAMRRIATESEADPRRYYAIRDGQPFDETWVRARLRFFDRLLRPIEDVVEIGQRMPLEVGRELADRFLRAA